MSEPNVTVDFSLILGTINRVEELSQFLDALDTQTLRNFELLIMDQNSDDRLAHLLSTHERQYRIWHLRSPIGLSRARNLGLQRAKGNLVGFPDDDCWYHADLLERVRTFFEAHPTADAVSGSCIDASGTILRRGPQYAGWITKYNLFHRVHSFTVFFRRGQLSRIGPFDETMGVGSGTPWGSAEDHDYTARGIEAGLRIYYDPSIGICHPDAPSAFNAKEIQKEFGYSRGSGRFIAKNGYPTWYLGYRVLRSLGGALIGLCRLDLAKVQYHWTAVIGRIEGWWSIYGPGSSV
jgi:glycosyltransferase involved in cell wall biosynthesis